MSQVPSDDRPDPRPHSKWPRRLIILFILLLPPTALLQFYTYFYWAGTSDLEAAMAETDRLDPGWRWDEWETRRAVIPDEENSALQVIKVVGIEGGPSGILSSSLYTNDLAKLLDSPAPVINMQFNAAQIKGLRDALKKNPTAVLEARKLADMPYGRYTVKWYAADLGVPLLHIESARRLSYLLWLDSLLLAQEGDIDDALVSSRAEINNARAFGDESTGISTLTRFGLRSAALRNIARILAQGIAWDETLAALQEVLLLEAEEPLLLRCMRGERAYMFRVLEWVHAGKIPLLTTAGYSDIEFLDKEITGNRTVDNWLKTARLMYQHGPLRRRQAALLRFMNQCVEIAKLPPNRQHEEIIRFQMAAQMDRPEIEDSAMIVGNVADAIRRNQATLHSMIVALAAERFRLEHDRWPESVQQLTPDYLDDIPRDPFDNKLVKFASNGDGLVVYCLGDDGIDDSGRLDPRRYGTKKGFDIGIQLFDPDKRGLPAKEDSDPEPE